MTSTTTPAHDVRDFNADMAAIDGQSPCPNCGGEVAAKSRGMIKLFCKPTCRQAFHQRNQKRGQVLAPLIVAQTLTRHAKEGSAEAAVCTFARREITAIAADFAAEDREAGRPPASAYIDAIRRTGTLYADRKR